MIVGSNCSGSAIGGAHFINRISAPVLLHWKIGVSDVFFLFF
jgi:hypothetical protein